MAPPAEAADGMSLAERAACIGTVEAVLGESREWPDLNPGSRPGPTLTYEDLTQRALDTIRASNALGRFWGRPITAVHLRAETDRIGSRTKDPAILRRVIDRLGGDRALLAECLARPLLAERMLRSGFNQDARIHAATMAAARVAVEGAPDVETLRRVAPDSSVLTYRRGDPSGPARDESRAWILSQQEWLSLTDRVAETPQAGALTDYGNEYALLIRLRGDDESVTVLRLSWPKRSFESWWSSVAGGLGDDLDPTPSEEEDAPGPKAMTTEACGLEEWSAIASGPPDPRKWHTMVWTGREAIVWGGCGGAAGCGSDTGARYDALTDTWTPVSTEGAPDRRFQGAAAWTGQEMFVWGGQKAIPAEPMDRPGGLYDPATDTWRPVSTFPAPTTISGQTAVWTGSEVIVFGNAGTSSTVWMYNPDTDTWRAVGPAPHNMRRHTAVWTGTQMLAWGGSSGNASSPFGISFDPATDTWGTLPPAPITPRSQHTAVWTGTEMIVWGGGGFDSPSAEMPGTGAAYNPATGTWRELSVIGAPASRGGHVTVWTGTEMIVWGGRSALGFGESFSWPEGGRYNPSSDTWSELEPYAFAEGGGTENAAALWTGTEMIVWGGDGRNIEQAIGGRYDPVSGTWLALGGASAPSGRNAHRPVWTGMELVVWGGGVGYPMQDGRRYRPAFDAWLPMTMEGAPSARSVHEAVWTGREMVVTSGFTNEWADGGSLPRSGGRYDPAADSWKPTTEQGAPTGRFWAASAWTGTEMVVWGGYDGSDLADGGRYDPAADRWTTMTASGAPQARSEHEIVWGGSRAIVWGGYPPTNSGARYDPADDTWTPTTATDAPTARYRFTAVWLAERMTVWGGAGDFSKVGGAYDPTTDHWEELEFETAPRAAHMHRAVRAGQRMIVWGGYNANTGGDLAVGGVYDPATDSWRETPTAGDPKPRYSHAQAWTGHGLLVWGGLPQQSGGAFVCIADTGAPDVPVITSPVEGALLNATVTIAGTAQIGTEITVRRGTDTVGTATVSGMGTWSVSASLADGTHTVTATSARLSDESGPSLPRTFTVDTTVPSVTITSGPEGTDTAREATFRFTANDPVDFSCRLDAGTPTPCTSPHTITGLAAGPHTFEVWGTNAAGNTGPPATRNWVIEPVPGVVITNVPDPIRDHSAVALSVSGTADPGSMVEVTVSDGVRATSPEGTTADDAGIWNVSGMDVTGIANGPVLVTAVSTAPDGDVSSDERVVSKRESTKPPSVSISSNGFGYVGPDDTPEAVEILATYRGPEASQLVEVTLTDSAGNGSAVGSATLALGETRSFTVDLSDSPDGVVTAHAEAEGLTASASVTLDRGAPVVSIDPHQPVMVHASPLFSNVVFRGEATDEVSPIWTVRVTVARDGGPVFTMAASRSAYDRELRWTADLRGFGLVRGSYTITVVATDEAGNTSEPASTSVEILSP